MKLTLTLILMTLALGCQGDAPGGGGSGGGGDSNLVSTTEAEARAVCDQANLMAIGQPVHDVGWQGVLINSETMRDEGITKGEFIVLYKDLCFLNTPTQEAYIACVTCWTYVADITY